MISNIKTENESDSETENESENDSENENENEKKYVNKSKPNDTILELQLGDIINITNPLNEQLNEQTFIIDYIDKSKTYLINTETLDRIRVNISEDGTIGDGNISRIGILSRNDTPSYARQNGLLPDKWVNIYFSGDYPIILTGEITNLENDMIEIKTIDGDTIYINFDYKGIPEDLPIEMIEIREKPSEPLTKAIEEEQEQGFEEQGFEEQGFEELEKENVYIEPEKFQINVPVKDIKDQLREFIVKADQIKFGDEVFGPIVQYVDVSSKSQRYSLESQVSDLLDELLSTIPNSERTPRVLNNIHIMIERFKQLRTNFSLFDQYGNVEGPIIKEASYKPLVNYFKNFNTNLYWILPVVKNIKKVYDIENVYEENYDIINLEIDSNLANMRELIENYKSNDLPTDQNKYSSLYSELNPYFTPYDLVSEENMNGVIIEKEVNGNINTIIDNLGDMYSTIFNNNSIRNRRFVIQKYNLSNTKLDTIDSTSSRLVTVRTNISKNDIMSINSFITLPEPIIRFSKINLPGTDILEKANLNLLFLNYWELLKKKTSVSTNFIDNLDNEIEFNEKNFSNNIKNFVLNLSSEDTKGITQKEIYDKFINIIIPKTRILFNLMKKYITGKLSIVEVVSYLEPFLVYSDDLTYMQYVEITKFIDDKISSFNKNFIERSKLFKTLSFIKSGYIIPSRAYSIIEIINRNLREDVFNEGYDMSKPESTFTNSEILRKLIIRDYSKLYTTTIALQSVPLMFPSEFSSLFEEEKNKIDEKLKKEQEQESCSSVVISKYYTSIDELDADNNVQIYFDKKYDKTNYGILEDKNGYEKEVLTMSPEELYAHITKDLMEKKKMSEHDAEYLSDTLVNGHKKVIDGQYAILYKGYKENAADEVDYYIRKDNKWILDKDVSNEDINTDESSILCNIQKQCISVPSNIDDKCESMKENELSLQTNLLKHVISEFDTKYKLSKEDFLKNIQGKFDYFLSISGILTKIEINNMIKYNNQRYKLGANIEDGKMSQISPFAQFLNLILGQKEFVKKQTDIIKFVNNYTRPAIKGLGPLNEVESEHWLYCIKTNVPLLPVFKYNLANSFVVEGQYEYKKYLEIVKSQIGKLSDDGDWWTDENSGWSICRGDFDVEEGYDEGFKISSRAVMEDDAGNKISAGKIIKYDTPDTIMINNIINAISVAMGINIEVQKEFIINCVLTSIRDTVETEIDYKQKVREMAEKGKKIPSYKDFYNTAILYYTLGMFLLAVQTAIPSVKTRKTHPGCIRSFTGYPFEGAGDLSSLTYIGCVAYDIRESGEPWNVLKGKKKEIIINKIKGSIDDILLTLPDVKRKFEEKTDYLLTASASEIPEEHDITNWTQFLPPLVKFKIKHLTNISPEFKKGLINDLRNGSIYQREKILVVDSKIILFTMAIIERIQDVVKKHNLLLHTSNGEPYLENACCESQEGESTIDYFSKKDPRIIEYNEIVTQLSNIMEDIISHSKSGLFYSNVNTKNKYPSINPEFNEKTIYLAFIYFCKFKSLIPISQDLLPYCTSKPDVNLINFNDSTERIIQKLKNDGRNYSNDQFLRLLQVISKNNIININLNSPEISSITRLVKILEVINEENEEVIEKSIQGLINNALDSFDIATENYTKEVEKLNNQLIRNIESMKEEIIEFIQKNTGTTITNKTIRKTVQTIENLANWVSDDSTRYEDVKISDDKLYNIVNFYKNFINNFVNVFPNIILNKVNYNEIHIPNYYGFSLNHSSKLKKYVSEYYEKLKKFYDIPILSNILTTIQKSSKNLVLISNCTPSFTSIKIDDKVIKPVFDERTSRFLFEYYLLRILINYIELSSQEDMIVHQVQKEVQVTDIFTTEYLEETETRIDLSITSRKQVDTRLLTGNKKELKQKISELLICFIEILNSQKNTIDTSYEEIQDRVFKLREKEKDLVTDRLKRMTDEERDTDTILKINKLGMYSKGLQKGLITLDKDFYDEEQKFRDEMLKAEKNIRKNNLDANDENIDILLNEFMEQQQNEDDIDAEVYDMGYMNEDYYDGNTDGVGAPEEDYDGYQDYN